MDAVAKTTSVEDLKAIYQLSEHELAEFKEAFALFDKDGDGHVTQKELGLLLKSLGQHQTKQEIANMISNVDVEGDGTVTFPEFLCIIAPKMNEEISKSDIVEAFEVLDEENRGVVQAKCIRHMWTTMGEKLTHEEVDRTFSAYGVKDDGAVTFKQFAAMVMSA